VSALVAKDVMVHDVVSQGRPPPNVMIRYQVRIESNDDPRLTPRMLTFSFGSSTISIKCMNMRSAEVSPNAKRLDRRIVLKRGDSDEYKDSSALILILFQLWVVRYSSDAFSECRYKRRKYVILKQRMKRLLSRT
jgi:hypothetical protein